MNVNNELVKNLRTSMKMTQAKIAQKLYMDERTYRRIENGETKIDIWKFNSFCEILGLPYTDYWLLFLETNEYNDYVLYKKVQKLFDEERVDESISMLTQLEKSSLGKNPFTRKSIEHMRLLVDLYYTNTKDRYDYDKVLFELYRVLNIKNFNENEIQRYQLTNTEVKILNHIAAVYWSKNERVKTIKILKSIIEASDNFKMSEEAKAKRLPVIMCNLGRYLIDTKEYDESIDYLEEAIKYCCESSDHNLVPQILLNLAQCHYKLKKDEQKHIDIVKRAYYSALAIGRLKLALRIKEKSKKIFDFEII